jgi:adenylate cyclase
MARLRDLMQAAERPGFAMPGWLERITSCGIVSDDPQVVRRQRFTNLGAYAAAANAGSHLVINAMNGPASLMPVQFYNAAFVIATLMVPLLHRFGPDIGAFCLVLLILAGNTYVVWMLGTESALHVYLTLAGAMLFMFGVERWRLFLGWFALVALVLGLTVMLAPEHGMLLGEDDPLHRMLSSHAMLNTIAINALLIFYALSSLRQAEAGREAEHARSEALLAALMPHAVAARLKAGANRIAERIDNLSVLFADLAGFTSAARNLPPEEVVAFLDTVVRRFDELAERHGVEKIKTIGDSYMAVGGLDGRAEVGAEATARFALALIDETTRLPPLGGTRLALRIGIHAGPATAGVIGETRFSYDVWGDAVNTAARMEGYGEAGRIQVTPAFRALAGEAFVYQMRGGIDMKGLGIVETAFLSGNLVI